MGHAHQEEPFGSGRSLVESLQVRPRVEPSVVVCVACPYDSPDCLCCCVAPGPFARLYCPLVVHTLVRRSNVRNWTPCKLKSTEDSLDMQPRNALGFATALFGSGPSLSGYSNRNDSAMASTSLRSCFHTSPCPFSSVACSRANCLCATFVASTAFFKAGRCVAAIS